MSQSAVTESELHAYVDGLVPEKRRGEIEAYLVAHPHEASRIAAYQAQNSALRVLYDPVLEELVPSRLTATPRATSLHLQRYAAGLVIAFASGATGWFLHGVQNQVALPAQELRAGGESPQLASLAHQAAVAHAVYSPDARRPVEVGADQEAHLVTWLSKRLGTPIRPPKLGKLGYDLIGGRLLPGQSGPVAQFMYQDRGQQRLTLYVSTEQSRNKDTSFRFSEQGPVNVFYWIDGKFGYALSGAIDKATLANVAAAVYEQLDKPP